MDAQEMKKCPYCAELIKAEAIKCRYCGSNLTGKNIWQSGSSAPQFWRRVNEGKKIAGVCTGIERQLDAPILLLPLRLFFVLTTLFYGFGLILYIILWILMSPPVDKPGQARSTYAGPPPPQPPAGPCPPPAEPRPSSAEPGPPSVEPNPEQPSETPPPSGTELSPPENDSSPQHMKGLMLLLATGGVLFLIFLIFGGWGLHYHPFKHFPFSGMPVLSFLQFPGLPSAEWVKLLIVGGLALIILAGMDVIAMSVVPLVLVGAGALYISRFMHIVSFRGMVIAGVIGAVLLAGYWIVRRFSRSSGALNHCM
ncbi:MAG: PspC domain-containing protein [Candidatus Latescibacterota bacterium]